MNFYLLRRKTIEQRVKSDESIKAKIELAVHRLFTKKQNPVEEEVVEEEVVAEEVEIKESAFENVPQRKKNVINISRKTTNRSRGRVKANNNLISLTSESGRLALDLPSYREVSLNLNPLAIFRVSTNQGSDSALGKTADLIMMQTSKLYNYIRDNPESAKYIAYAPVAMRGMIAMTAAAPRGPMASVGAGAMSVLSQEAYSYVVERALGEKLSQVNKYVVNKVANFIRDTFDPSLSIEQATALSTAVIIGSLTARSIRADTRAVFSALDRMSRPSVKIDIVRNSTFFFKGESGSGDVGSKAGGRLAIKVDSNNQRKTNCLKAESSIWKGFKPHKGKYKTNNETGKKKQYYEWDYLHNEIEVYDHNWNPIHAMDPIKGTILNKDVSKHKKPKNM
jgi:hypothetical protein